MTGGQSETTMEDILASIKKIIADDGSPAPRSFSRDPIPESVRPRLSPRDEVLDLTVDDEATVGIDETPSDDVLVSAPAEAATRSALDALASAVATPDVKKTAIATGVTVEQLASDLLRPMLKEWLDAHLPEIVERVVAKEVARITKRG